MYVFGSGRHGCRGAERMRRLGLDFINLVGTVLDVYFGSGCVGGVVREWVGAWTRVWRLGWCYVCVRCDPGFSV